LWVAAGAIVAWLVVRYRGRLTLMADHRLPRRLVYMVAVLLVLVGLAGAERFGRSTGTESRDLLTGSGYTPPGDAPYRKRPVHGWFDDAAAEAYARAHGPMSRWLQLKQATGGFRESTGIADEYAQWLRSSVSTTGDEAAAWLPLAEVVAMRSGLQNAGESDRSPTAAELLAALDAAEQSGFYDAALVGYLWRAIPRGEDFKSPGDAAQLLARLETHARLLVAITLAKGRLGPVHYQPWMSKAAPPAGYRALRLPEGFGLEVMRQFNTAAAGTWHDEATARLIAETTGEGALLLRRGESLKLTSGDGLTFRRFDMLRAPDDAPLHLHDRQIDLALHIPAGTTVGPRELSGYLTPASRQTVDRLVAAARAGDRDASIKLEWALPLTHDAIRRSIAETPEDAGPLPMLLMLYDY
jgi:hypothetical protein